MADKILKHFGDSTSLHGVPHVIKAHSHKLRFVWSVICLFSTGMAISMLYQLVEKYSSHPVTVRVHEVCIHFQANTERFRNRD